MEIGEEVSLLFDAAHEQREISLEYEEQQMAFSQCTGRLLAESDPTLCAQTLTLLDGVEPLFATSASRERVPFFPLIDGDGAEQSQGGYFVRWQSVGVVINPGRHFVQRFLESGHQLDEIHAVIVTEAARHKFCELELLSRANLTLNQARVQNGQEPHVIHYYLHPEVFRHMGALIRPQFRQERGCVTSLETFAELGHIESYALDPAIRLSVMRPQQSDKMAPLAITLALTKEAHAVTLGYLAGMQALDAHATFLSRCTLLILGIGEVRPDDFESNIPAAHCLGYSGSQRLLEQLHPQLVFCTEFATKHADVRFEMVKKIKERLHLNAPESGPATILAAPIGMTVDLDTMTVPLANEEGAIPCEMVRLIRSATPFGALSITSSRNIL